MAFDNQSLGFWRANPTIGTKSVSAGGSSSNIGLIGDILSNGSFKGVEGTYSDAVERITAALPPGVPLEVGKLARALHADGTTLADVLHKAAVEGKIKLVRQRDGSIFASRP